MFIGGLQKLTLIDYPGKIATTVFLIGCNFSCPWCYNPELVLPEKIKNIKLFERKSDRESANWLFSMHVKKRVDFIRMMLKKGIEVSVVHNRIDSNGAFGPLRKDLRQLAKFTETHISIPLHNCLSDDDVDYILKCIRGGW